MNCASPGFPRIILLIIVLLSASGSIGEDYATRAEARDYNARGLTPEERLKVQQMTREWEATHPRK